MTEKYETGNLNSQFSKLTAEIKMIASDKVISQYMSVAKLYDNWAKLYIKAFPKPTNGYKMLYSKHSDPTQEYKILEKEAYSQFYKEYQHLIEIMRSEIQVG